MSVAPALSVIEYEKDAVPLTPPALTITLLELPEIFDAVAGPAIRVIETSEGLAGLSSASKSFAVRLTVNESKQSSGRLSAFAVGGLLLDAGGVGVGVGSGAGVGIGGGAAQFAELLSVLALRAFRLPKRS